MAVLSGQETDYRAAIETQLSRMCSAALFRRKPRVRSFLEFTVRQTLDNQHAKLKEYSIAVEVFHRPEDFDPRLDSIVRVEARRLRATVERYYETEGREDLIVIRYRRGSYIPAFETRDEQSAATNPALADALLRGAGGDLLIGVLAGAQDYADLAARQSSASLTILRAPFEVSTLERLRSGDSQLVLLRRATAADIDRLLAPDERE
jgi:hypothetical protein